MCEYKSSFAILSSVSSDIQPQQPQGVGSHSGAGKGINTPFFETEAVLDFFLMLGLVARFVGTNNRACLIRLQKTHASTATVTLLTSIIEVSLLHASSPRVLMNGKVGLHEPFFLIQKGKKASSIKQNEITNLFNETKLQKKI